jgi:hypothetical protein
VSDWSIWLAASTLLPWRRASPLARKDFMRQRPPQERVISRDRLIDVVVVAALLVVTAALVGMVMLGFSGGR